jgi:Flp pilus assembly protein TadD
VAKRIAPPKEPAPAGGTAVARAHELFKQGRSGEALALLRPLLQRKDVDGEAAALAAACLGAEGKYEEAARVDRLMCDSQPDNAQGWQSLGYDLFQAGDLPGALEAYARAIELEPNRASTHYNLARIMMRMGEKPKAIEHFIHAVELQADFVERLDEDPDLLPLKDDPELQDRLPGRAPGPDPYAEYYATKS